MAQDKAHILKFFYNLKNLIILKNLAIKLFSYLVMSMLLTNCQTIDSSIVEVTDLPDSTIKYDKTQDSSLTPKIGVILPISNNHTGKAMMDAIMLALHELKDNKNKIELKVFNTEDSKNSIENIKDAIVKEKIKLVLGPIYSDESLDLAIQLRDNNIKVISFSNNPTINGSNLFLLGITPQMQLNNILEYQLDNQYNNYFLLLPSNNKGRFYAAHASKFLMNSDGQINGVEYYADNMIGVNEACQNILKKIKATKGKKVLFFSDTKSNMHKLIEQLKLHGLDNHQDLQLISTFDIEEIDSAELIKLSSIKFAGPPLSIRENFKQRFHKEFGYEPPMLASLAYDSLALTINVAASDFSNEVMQNTRGFKGINGLFRFEESKSLAERNLTILEFKQGKLFQIENYKKTFHE